MSAVVQLPAGRSFRRSDTAKWVDPQPEKGVVEVRLDQGIVNFVWRNKDTSTAEDELLIFPAEAEFLPVRADASGRTYVLKFNSSNQVHFFWLQRGTLGEADARACADINAILQDPDYVLGTAPIPNSYRPPVPATPAPAAAAAAADAPGAPEAKRTATTAPAAASSADAGPSSSTGQDQNQDMARLLFQWAENNLPIPDNEDASLADILTPETVSRLVAERPQLADELAHHMPPELAGEGAGAGASGSSGATTAQTLLRVVGTPQFRDAVSSLEMALRNGTLPESMMPWAHAPEGAAWNLRTFLAALREVKDESKDTKDDDKMETD